MKTLLYILLIAFAFSNCKEHHETRIVLKNNTDYNLQISMNPNSSAEGVKHNLQLSSEYPEQGIYRIDVPDYDPRTLLSDGYTSFIVELENSEKKIIGFSKYTDPNYELNPYKDLGSWEYDEFYYTYLFNYSKQETLIHEYTFSISEELITE